MNDEARDAYDAWAKVTAWDVPSWHDLPPDVRAKWDAATQSAMQIAASASRVTRLDGGQ